MLPRGSSSRMNIRRRYSALSKVPLTDNSVLRFSEARTNSALFQENIKQEIKYFDGDHLEGTPTKMRSSSKRRSFVDSQGVLEGDIGADSVRRARSYAKHEDDAVVDSGDATFNLFASLLDSAIQGVITSRKIGSLVFSWMFCFDCHGFPV